MNDEEFRIACQLDADSIMAEFKHMRRWRWYEIVIPIAAILYGIYMSPWVQAWLA